MEVIQYQRKFKTAHVISIKSIKTSMNIFINQRKSLNFNEHNKLVNLLVNIIARSSYVYIIVKIWYFLHRHAYVSLNWLCTFLVLIYFTVTSKSSITIIPHGYYRVPKIGNNIPFCHLRENLMPHVTFFLNK